MTETSSAASPSRDKLVRIFARRFQESLSLKEAGELFDDYMRLGYLNVDRDPLTGEWRVLLTPKKRRQ